MCRTTEQQVFRLLQPVHPGWGQSVQHQVVALVWFSSNTAQLLQLWDMNCQIKKKNKTLLFNKQKLLDSTINTSVWCKALSHSQYFKKSYLEQTKCHAIGPLSARMFRWVSLEGTKPKELCKQLSVVRSLLSGLLSANSLPSDLQPTVFSPLCL